MVLARAKRRNGHASAGTKARFVCVRAFCLGDILRGVGRLQFDLRLPVGISDRTILRKLFFPGRVDRLKNDPFGRLIRTR
jgi:hypothetical protein